MDQTFLALADSTRRGVVEALRSRPYRAGELAHAFSMSRPAMSRHLRVLRQAGLVIEDSPDDDARVRIYRLQRERFDELRGWLDEIESFWTEQLTAFKDFVESRPDSETE